MNVKFVINEIFRLFGIILFWVGLCLFAYYDPIAISTVIAALFMMPSVFYLFFKSTRLTETFRAIAIVVFLCLPGYGWFMSAIGHPIEGKNEIAVKNLIAAQQRIENEKNKAIKRFQDNRETIIRGIRHYYDQGNYRFAFAHADEFVFTNDPELMELHEKSKQKLIEAGEYKDPDEK